ncbi:hypothetical protein EDC04DRAFT_2868896 [Pisolithus marmoratus]|nr:hypothetical protein EDC04DRAFT_2868896 [Pisolithus marmoratus]
MDNCDAFCQGHVFLASVPPESSEENVSVVIERSYLLAGVEGQQPIMKGRLYGNVDVVNSAWQLEPWTLQPSTHHFSIINRNYYAFISELEISSSFTTSLQSSQTSDAGVPVPIHSSPTSSAEEQLGYRKTVNFASGKGQVCHWPSSVVGPVPQELSPSAPIPTLYDRDLEAEYNMDPTTHPPSTTMKLVTRYLPPHTSSSHVNESEGSTQGTSSWQPCQEAGLLHLEGATSVVLSASYATLSLIRVPPQLLPENDAEVWQQDRDAASRYFDRARAMNSDLNIQMITDKRDRAYSGQGSMYSEQERVTRQRRQGQTKDELIFIDDVEGKDDIDNAWYLCVPSLVGAGTALLVVGVIGALSFSSWRRNQGPTKP